MPTLFLSSFLRLCRANTCQITSGVRLPFQEVGVEVDWDRISALQVTLEGLFLEEDKRQSQIPPKPIVGVPLAQLSLVAEHRLHAPVPITAWLTSEWPQAIFVTTDLTKLPRLVSQVGALVAAIKEQLKVFFWSFLPHTLSHSLPAHFVV